MRGRPGRHRLLRAGCGTTVVFALLLACADSTPTAREALPTAGTPAPQRILRTDDHHRYDVDLRAGDALVLRVEQAGIDLDVTVRGPDGTLLVYADGLSADQGHETVTAVAAATGAHRVDIQPLPAHQPVDGHYRLDVRARRPATAADRARFAGLVAWAAGEDAYRHEPDAARAAYARARDQARQAGDEPVLLCRALRRLGQLHEQAGDLDTAATLLEQARGRCHGHAHPIEMTGLLNALGDVYYLAGEHQRAQSVLVPALALARETGRRPAIAAARNTLAMAQHATGHLHAALRGYAEAEALWQALGDAAALATARHNLGVAYSSLGRLGLAIDLLERARASKIEVEDTASSRAKTALVLGSVLTEAGRADEALALFDQALEDSEDAAEQGLTHDVRARALLALGRPAAARADAEEALRIASTHDHRPIEAHAFLTLGLVDQAEGRWSGALERFRQAGEAFRAQGNDVAVAEVLVAEARTARALGDPATSAAKLDRALAVLDGVGNRLAAPGIRTDFRGSRHGVYREAIDLWLDLAFALGDSTAAVRAFEIGERGRGRSLLAGVATAVAPETTHADPAHALEARLAANENQRLVLDVAGQREAAAALDAETDTLLRTLEQLPPGSRGPRAQHFAPLTLDQVRRQFLDEETVLLTYALGEARSALWMVSRDQFAVVALPPRAHLDTLARRAHALLSEPPDPLGGDRVADALTTLSRTVLEPAAALLAGRGVRRLLVVADGALHYVPFGVLPSPIDRAGGPLIESHEIVQAPSASVLAWLRARAAARPRPAHDTVVFGDPVFDDRDPRLDAVAARIANRIELDADPRRTFETLGFGPITRLPASGREANDVFALADAPRSRLATGFAATRDAFLDPSLADFRLLHIATHGLLDATRPELSGLIFALLDPEGGHRPGLVQALAISRLHLPADLVVLSACRTALGKEVPGEGLVGLPHAFLQAGASRVITSHWQVSDRATAELMIRFHRALRQDRLGPAAALRQAQRDLRREPAWGAPYHWGGLTLLGDWRPFLDD